MGTGELPTPNFRRWLLARPVLSVVVLFVLGIALHSQLYPSPIVWMSILAGLILVAGAHANHPHLCGAFLALAIIFSGVIAGQLNDYQFPANHIGCFATDETRLVQAELEFHETPKLTSEDFARHVPPRQVGMASVVLIRTWQGWESASGDILTSLPLTTPCVVAGQKIRVVGMLQRPAPAMNPGQFDWQSYDRRQRILASIRVSHASAVQVLEAGGSPALAATQTGVREWLALGFTPAHQVDRALLQTLMLGDRGPELHEIERDFQKTGTSHLLSSSGVRMAVLAAITFFLCRLMRLPPLLTVILIALSVMCWGSVTLASPQGVRPVIIAATLGLGIVWRRAVDPIQLLSIAALGILLIRPLDIYSAGFQFSFIIVLGMVLLTPRLTTLFARFQNADEEVLEKFARLTWKQQAKRWVSHRLKQAFAVAVIAWIVSVPLVAYHFEQFTPWAVPISILLAPLVFAALGLGFFKLMMTMLAPALAPMWATIALWPVALLRWSISHLAKLPAADVPITAPPVWAIVLFYVLLCMPLLPVTHRAVRCTVRCGPVGAFLLLLCVPWLLGFARQSASGGVLRVTLLSIGAGQCGVVELPGRGAIMLDAGSSTVTDPLHSCIAPFLHHEGQGSVESIFLSHGDFDHISAAGNEWMEYGEPQVITTPFFREHARESVPCRQLLELLDSSGHPPRQVCAGQTFDWGDGVTAEVLWPTKRGHFDSNNAGMVLRFVYGGKSILFPADIQDPAMQELLKTPEKLRSDILVAPHHGSSETLTAEFVQAVNPEIIVTSDATRLTKKQRDFERLIGNRPLYRTGQCGAIEIDFGHDGTVRVKPFIESKEHARVIEPNGSVHVTR